jgi:hypothetical protein
VSLSSTRAAAKQGFKALQGFKADHLLLVGFPASHSFVAEGFGKSSRKRSKAKAKGVL